MTASQEDTSYRKSNKVNTVYKKNINKNKIKRNEFTFTQYPDKSWFEIGKTSY